MHAPHAFTNELIWDNEIPIGDDKMQTFKFIFDKKQFAFVITNLHGITLLDIYSNHHHKKSNIQIMSAPPAPSPNKPPTAPHPNLTNPKVQHLNVLTPMFIFPNNDTF